MSPWLVLALALPAVAAWGLLPEPGPRRRRTGAALAGRAACAVLIGHGAASILAFAVLLGGGALDGRFVAIDAGVFAALAVAGAVRSRRSRRTASPGGAEGGALRRPMDLLAAVLLVAALVAAGVAFLRFVEAVPHGKWDAWAIWNLRARYLLRAGPDWRAAFAPELLASQLGYPLLVPLAVARCWAWAGESVAAPAAIAALFTLATVLALGAAVARAAGNVAGAVAALVLLGTSQFVLHGATQYADVPLAASLVAALGLLLHARDEDGRPRRARLVAAGLLLGLAGWTKNEGIAAALAVLLAHVALPGADGRRRTIRDLAPLAAGAAGPALAWVLFHLAVAPDVAPALAQHDGGAFARKLLDAGRWQAVLAALWGARPGGAEQVPAVALALAFLVGARPRAMLRSPALLAAALLLAGYALVYVTTPQDLAWHLESSAERVLLHAWPWVLLALFGAAAPCEGETSSGAPERAGT